MENLKINIGDKQFQAEVFYTDEEKEKGLSNRESLDPDTVGLFIWDEPETIGIWMKETSIPLDIAFINEDLVVFAVHQGVPQSEEIIEHDDTVFVVEANVNSGIKVGDELEFSPEKKGKMIVLDENGNNQMELSGGERIMSRVSSLILIRKAKKAAVLKTDGSYKSLGKYLFKELSNQDNRDPEFVKN